MTIADLELNYLCMSLWKGLELPFEWDADFNTRRKYRQSFTSTLVVLEDETKLQTAERLVKTLSIGISEHKPVGVSKVIFCPKLWPRKQLVNSGKIKALGREVGLPFSVSVCEETSTETYKSQKLASLEACAYYDVSSTKYIRKACFNQTREIPLI